MIKPSEIQLNQGRKLGFQVDFYYYNGGGEEGVGA